MTILLFAAGLAIVYVARSVIVIFAFSILFAYLIDPIGRFLQRHSLFFKKQLARPCWLPAGSHALIRSRRGTCPRSRDKYRLPSNLGIHAQNGAASGTAEPYATPLYDGV